MPECVTLTASDLQTVYSILNDLPVHYTIKIGVIQTFQTLFAQVYQRDNPPPSEAPTCGGSDS